MSAGANDFPKHGLPLQSITGRGGSGQATEDEEEDEVAAKHDNKRARANFWVMQQNMAKQKGGRRPFLPKPRKPKLEKSAPALDPAAVPTTETTDTTTPAPNAE